MGIDCRCRRLLSGLRGFTDSVWALVWSSDSTSNGTLTVCTLIPVLPSTSGVDDLEGTAGLMNGGYLEEVNEKKLLFRKVAHVGAHKRFDIVIKKGEL